MSLYYTYWHYIFIITLENGYSWIAEGRVSPQERYSDFILAWFDRNNNLQMYRLASVCRSLPQSEKEHLQVELDHVDTKIEKNQNRCTYLERGIRHTVHFPLNCTGPPICLVLGGSSAHTPAVFSVHCWADEEATTEGRRQLGALGWEVKQRLGGCWMAGWTGPLVVHFLEPRRRWRDQYVNTDIF